MAALTKKEFLQQYVLATRRAYGTTSLIPAHAVRQAIDAWNDIQAATAKDPE